MPTLAGTEEEERKGIRRCDLTAPTFCNARISGRKQTHRRSHFAGIREISFALQTFAGFIPSARHPTEIDLISPPFQAPTGTDNPTSA
jgi:hypothetical protein